MSVLLWILAFGSALAAGLLVYRADKRKGVPRPWLTGLLRSLVWLLAWLLLLSPTLLLRQSQTRRQTVVILQDDSRSIGAALGNDTADFRKKLEDITRRLGKEVRVVPLAFGSRIRQDTLFRYADLFTHLTGALEAAAARSGKRPPAAVILATDGRYNAGSNPLYAPLPLAAPVHILSLGDTAIEKDLRIGRIYAPRTVARGSTFEVRADLLATGLAGLSTTATLTGGAQGAYSFTVTGDRFDRGASFTLTAPRAGLFSYTLNLPPAPGERNTDNNTRRFYVEVVDQKKKILLAAAVPHPDIKALREALASVENYAVTVQTGTAPNTDGYDVAILHGLPATTGTAPQIPTWYILAPTTSATAFNAAQQVATMEGTAQMQRSSYALPPAPGFSFFVPPPGLDALTDRLPPLSVSGIGWRTPADAQVLLRQRENAEMPLWVLRAGWPAGAVTVGEGIWRWRLSEYRQRKEQRIVDECIRQTVAFLAAGMGARKFRIDMPKWEWNDGEGVVLNGYLLNAGGQSVNDAEVRVSVTDSAGRARDFRMERVGSGYRLHMGSLLPGSYRFSGRVIADGKTYSDGGSFVVSEMPLELLQTGADLPFLRALAARFDGTVRPWQEADALVAALEASDVLKPRIETDETPKPLIDWKWMFLLILATATAEWLVRRYSAS